jgi:hypothetical protein
VHAEDPIHVDRDAIVIRVLDRDRDPTLPSNPCST